jgi:hypothetical protein
MEMKPGFYIGFAVLIAGCATSSGRLDRDLRPYVGQNIAALSAVLGDPESERELVGETQYTWTVDNHFTLTLQRFNTNLDALIRAPYIGIQRETQDVAMHYVCILQVVTDHHSVIKTFHSHGNEGCRRFATALNM